MENQPYLLTELEDLSSIFSPLKTTSRIKYTCFNASNNFLIFGATSGGLYVFRREPCCFLQLLPNKEGTVTQVSISPNEKLIAFSTVKGTICILEKTSHGAKHLITTMEHQNEQITSLQWNGGNNELFIGDNTGKVSIVMVSIFPTKGMFQSPSFVLMQLDSKIVQMDFSSNMLLVSTLTKCYICDTKKEIFRQVGHKLRDGEYGACILNTQSQNNVLFESDKVNSEGSSLGHLKLFCARPGSRVWECTMDGTVMSTHHFKGALAVPPRRIHFLNESSSQSNGDVSNGVITNGTRANSEQINSNYPEQSFNFQKLQVIMSKFFFTYKTDGLYVFDPQKGVVVLWNNQIKNIVDAKSANDVIYVWSGFDKMYALNLLPLEKLLVRLYFQKKYLELAKLCVEFKSFLIAEANNHKKLYVIHDLEEKLRSAAGDGYPTEELCNDLKPIVNIYKEKANRRKIQNCQKLIKSDIYLVGRNIEMMMEDSRLFNQRKLLRPATYLNPKGRSHSVSPERFHNGTGERRETPQPPPPWQHQQQQQQHKQQHKGNSSSLPDLTNGETPEPEVSSRKPDTGKVLEICQVIRSKSSEVSDNLVFNLFDNILDLARNGDGDEVRPVAFGAYLVDDDVTLISDLLHSCLRSKLIFDWLGLKLNGNSLTAALKTYPAILLASHPAKSLELDFKLSKLLKLCSGILRESEIIEIIREANGGCYYYSLLEVLNAFRDSSLSSVSDSTLNLANVSSSPKVLNVAYFLISTGQIEQCSKYLNKVNLRELFYLMLKHEEASAKLSGKSVELVQLQCHTIFLTLIDRISVDVLLENGDVAIDNYVVNCLENLNSSASSAKESNCECGFPRINLQPSIAMFPEVGFGLVRKTWPKDPVRCLEICRRIPYLWRHLIFIRRNESLDSVLPLILQSGEIQELENRLSEVDEKVLSRSVQLVAKLKSCTCLNCDGKMKGDGETVSWTDLGLLCVKLSGPEQTLELFKKYSRDIDSGELNQSFYQSLIFSAIMEKHRKGLGRHVVNSLAGKDSGASPRIPAVSETVRREILGGKWSEKRELRHLESESHHWGVRVNFRENCRVCCLPLDTKALTGEAGLIVFRCAHAFHSACLQKENLECPDCKKTNSKGAEGGAEDENPRRPKAVPAGKNNSNC